MKQDKNTYLTNTNKPLDIIYSSFYLLNKFKSHSTSQSCVLHDTIRFELNQRACQNFGDVNTPLNIGSERNIKGNKHQFSPWKFKRPSNYFSLFYMQPSLNLKYLLSSSLILYTLSFSPSFNESIFLSLRQTLKKRFKTNFTW